LGHAVSPEISRVSVAYLIGSQFTKNGAADIDLSQAAFGWAPRRTVFFLSVVNETLRMSGVRSERARQNRDQDRGGDGGDRDGRKQCG
jgi:hypothetical protein